MPSMRRICHGSSGAAIDPPHAGRTGVWIGSNDVCGAKGNRTPDLLIANETLYQLSYSPLRFSAYARTPSQTKTAADTDRRSVALLVTGLIGGYRRQRMKPMKRRAMAHEFRTVDIGADTAGGTVVESLLNARY